MASITEILKQILSARYGRDVRQAIHDGIQQCYYDGKAGSIDLEARQDIQAIEGDVEALKENATFINKAVADLQAIKDITETTSTTLPNSHAGRFKFDEIGGVMEQDSTAGNQLWSYGDISSGSISNIPWSISAGEYTLSTASTSFELTIRVYYEDNSEEVFAFTQSPTTFTLKKNVVKCNYNSNVAIADVMVNAGTTALPHEKFTGGQPAPNPSYPMEIKKSVVSGVRTHRKNFIEPSTTSLVSMTYSNGVYTSSPLGSYSTCYIHLNRNSNFKKGTTMYMSAKVRIKSGSGALNWFILRDNKKAITANGTDKVNYVIGNEFIIASCKMTFQEDLSCDTILIQVNSMADNLVIEVKDIMVSLDTDFENYEPFQGTEITFSQPIELYGMNGVQDVIEDGKVNGKYASKQITSVIGFDSSGKLFRIGDFADIIYDGTDGLPADILCDSYITHELGIARTIDYGFTQYGKGLYIANKDWNYNLDTANNALASNPITVVYKLETPTTEALPIADQIALNSLATYDGITYVEFIYDGLEPTFKGEYGTSKVGGYTLESLLTARNNALK